MKGKLGVSLVISELIKHGIDAINTPHFWLFDIVTMTGLRLEVKFSNIGESKSGSGSKIMRFTFSISPLELKFADFIILVLNTQKGFMHYIIPKEKVTSLTIAFNPFSKQKSQYEEYLNRWDLIKKPYQELIKDPKVLHYFESQNFYRFLYGQYKKDGK